MSEEIRDYRDSTGEEALWTNSMFGGMPSYLISTYFPGNYIKKVQRILQVSQHPTFYLFICLLGTYILLLVFGLSPWLAIIGAIAYAFTSYFFIILEAGHNTKALAMAESFEI